MQQIGGYQSDDTEAKRRQVEKWIQVGNLEIDE